MIRQITAEERLQKRTYWSHFYKHWIALIETASGAQRFWKVADSEDDAKNRIKTWK